MSISRAGIQKAHSLRNYLKLGAAVLGLSALTGCVGVGGGYYDDGPGYVDTGAVFWGGDYHRDHDFARFSHRGAESRGAAHGGGGSHGGGGGGGSHGGGGGGGGHR